MIVDLDLLCMCQEFCAGMKDDVERPDRSCHVKPGQATSYTSMHGTLCSGNPMLHIYISNRLTTYNLNASHICVLFKIIPENIALTISLCQFLYWKFIDVHELHP